MLGTVWLQTFANNHPALFAAVESADPATILINYGALGVIVVLYVSGLIPSKNEVKNLKEQNAELRAIIAAFQAQASQTVPALARSAQVLEAIPTQAAGSLEEVRQTEARMLDILARLESATRKQEER